MPFLNLNPTKDQRKSAFSFVMKANGKLEAFDPHKLEQSLLRAKASPEIANKVIDHVRSELVDGTTTSQLYKHAFFLLHKFQSPAANRYSLKQAIMNFGPTGFPFEKYVAEIFRSQGFEALTNQIVMGGCVEHEVDIVAWNEDKLIMSEAKFHHQAGLKCDLKVALYVKARFDDLREATYFYGNRRRSVGASWLVTNTKFTTTAIQYGLCKGVTMIGWDYPTTSYNLRTMIEDGDLLPVTCLGELHISEQKILLDKGLVLCKQIKKNLPVLLNAGLPKQRAQKILDEVNQI